MALLTGAILGSGIIAADAAQKPVTPSSVVFAKVGDTIILQQDYEAALAIAMHKKFYHGKVPEGGAAALQREVGDTLILNILLQREAKRRGLKPDDTAIRQTIQQYEQRYRDNKQWQQTRAQLVPSLTKRLQDESMLSQLENLVRNVPPPHAKQIDEYYVAHPDQFTEPEQLRLSVILLKVDPSSSPAIWEETRGKGQDLVRSLRAGTDFSAQARIHSGDATAANGGDMGYLHRGMLPQTAQDVVDKLKQGDVSDPLRLLEGIAVFRLTDRKPPKLNPLESARERARDLWLREQGERAWVSLVARLKQETPIHVDESRYESFSAAIEKQVVKK